MGIELVIFALAGLAGLLIKGAAEDAVQELKNESKPVK